MTIDGNPRNIVINSSWTY